jgi:hypothetical protein
MEAFLFSEILHKYPSENIQKSGLMSFFPLFFFFNFFVYIASIKFGVLSVESFSVAELSEFVDT